MDNGGDPVARKQNTGIIKEHNPKLPHGERKDPVR